jgi:hypothetical protein
MMIQRLNSVSSPAAARLEKLELFGLPHSCFQRDDTARPDASGITHTATPYLGRDDFHVVPLFPLRLTPTPSAYEEHRDLSTNPAPYGVRWQAKRDTAFGTPDGYPKSLHQLSHPSSLRSPHPTAPTISTVARGIFASWRPGSLALSTPKNHPKMPVMSRIVAYLKIFLRIEPLSNQRKERI